VFEDVWFNIFFECFLVGGFWVAQRSALQLSAYSREA
jgi:hypothetical protein